MKRIGKNRIRRLSNHEIPAFIWLFRFWLVPFLFLLTGFTAHAQVPIIFQQGLGGYTGTHDTFFQTGNPGAIHGTETAWEWDSSDAGGMNFGFIRFDNIIGTNPGQIPPDAVILKAVLTLTVTGSGSADQIATMHELLVPFDDTQDFYSFGDGSGDVPLADQDYVAEPIASIPGPTSGDILELDVTEYIKKVAAGGNNYGLIFVPGGSDGVNVASSEAASGKPMLTVTIEGVAPTASRSFSKAGFIGGDAITVSIQVNLSQGSQDITVVETIPADWSVSAISDGGTLAEGKITWTLAGFSGSRTLTYTANAPASPKLGAQFTGVLHDAANHIIPIEGSDTLVVIPPLYKTGNVLAVGVWNDNSGSSDLAGCADLSDNNGVIYVQDTSAAGGWPAGTIFRWKVVFYDDGTPSGEEPGWQGRDFTNDTEANGWIQQTDVGFTIGYGGNDAENGETLLDSTNETVYTRSIFDARNYETISEMTLKLAGDDEAVAWLNGVLIGWTASGTSDRGETAPDYVFDTTISGGAGGLESGSNPTVYSGSGTRIFTFPVYLVEAPPVPVVDWSLF
ncbi:MAG TPA: DNRLRE domain-containing protein [bacterium]|nr:DNRLRE domain-containing protein [bacterium]